MENIKRVRFVLVLILFLNFAVAISKVIIGKITSSQAIMADGFHSLTDGMSNIVALVGIYIAAKPFDKEHQYGHTKFETIACLIISGMMFFLGGKIFTRAIVGFNEVKNITSGIDSILLLIATLIVNIFVCIYEYNEGKKLNSPILISDSNHTKSDIFVSLGVIASTIAIKLGLPPIVDTLAAIIVSGFIFQAAFEVARIACDTLTDKFVINNDEIENVLKEFKEIKYVHKIRNRGTLNDIHVDMHIGVDSKMSIGEGHKLSHIIGERLKEKINKNISTLIHIEPDISCYNCGEDDKK